MYELIVKDALGIRRTIKRTDPSEAGVTVDGIFPCAWGGSSDHGGEFYFVVAQKGVFSRVSFIGHERDCVTDYLGQVFYHANLERTMSPEQENDLATIIDATRERLDAKYRAGQKEHGGNGWEMGAVKLAENMEDEATDQVVYSKWLKQSVKRIRTHVTNAIGDIESRDYSIALGTLAVALREIDGIEGRK